MTMTIHLDSGKIIENEQIAEDYLVMSVLLSTRLDSALPGQFMMIRKQGVQDPLLRRPLGLYGVFQTEAGTVLEFLYRVVGKGTTALSRLVAGDTVDILGPLGKHFDIMPERSHIILLAGGIGAAPLSYFLEYLVKHLDPSRERPIEKPETRKMTFYYGAETSSTLVGLEKIKHFCSDVRIATDDGSAGFKGTITDLLRRDLPRFDQNKTCIYSCGPTPMIRTLAQLLQPTSIPCRVSMEERMACGIGACLGCSIKVRDPSSEWAYHQVCSDGPVFDLRDLLWK
ncbi:MAG: dihydroorotate dehydrogenase electron transfer subunit [Syntrophales bacterium]|jgi:dihydroorotate dehydrogenase electron transfer subunit